MEDEFTRGSVTEIPSDADNVYAFRVTGVVDDDTSKALSAYMNDLFDRIDEVHILFDLSRLEGRESSALLDADVLRSRLRAVANIGKYAVIGAPDTAERMIDAMDKIVPVDARTFDAGDADEAWAFVGATPLAA